MAGADRVRRRPLPPRRRRRDPAPRRPCPGRRSARPADHRQRRPAGRRPDRRRQGTGSVLHERRADDAGRPGQRPRRRTAAALPGRHFRGTSRRGRRVQRRALGEQERSRRAGRRLLSDVTLETRLRILRDLAGHLAASGRITSWTEVTTASLEAFLAGRPLNRHHDTYVLRRYFAWARQRKLILIDPAARSAWGSPDSPGQC